MQSSNPPPGWYADPEASAGLRYWDGSAWTEHRAEPDQQGSAAELLRAGQGSAEEQKDGTSFPLVVAGVLGGAALLIAVIFAVMVWIDSYGNGSARGRLALEQGINPSSAEAYCEDLATNVQNGGSAEGYWDLPWVLGCKRALG